MLRKRMYAALIGVAVLAAAGFGAAQLASAAVDDPALAGQRVWCIDANGLPHYLPSPCSKYKGMWYFGNGANLTMPGTGSAPTVTVTKRPGPSTESSSAVPPGTLTSFAGNGVFLVSKLTPGLYTSPAPTTGIKSCYWARLKGTSGASSDIIANHIGSGPATVTILASDIAFETSGCATWTLSS